VTQGPAIDWERAARTALKESGHRAGGARGAVISLLGRQHCCLSAHRISQELHESGSDIGIASIYRALELLHGMGLVQRVEIGDGGARFEPVVPGGEHHHHAVCDRCGRVTPFEDERIEKQLEQLAGNMKHSMSGHDLVIRGECSRCR
jgi:Fur family transcriptional regulator, ferric uptake regulator